MILCFELSMPGRASWNGKWSGDGRIYARIVNFWRSKKGIEEAKQILSKPCYRYHWSDGWSASVSVREVDAKEARLVRKDSDGFCGYDWMIDAIRRYGRIVDEHQLADWEKAVVS